MRRTLLPFVTVFAGCLDVPYVPPAPHDAAAEASPGPIDASANDAETGKPKPSGPQGVDNTCVNCVLNKCSSQVGACTDIAQCYKCVADFTTDYCATSQEFQAIVKCGCKPGVCTDACPGVCERFP